MKKRELRKKVEKQILALEKDASFNAGRLYTMDATETSYVPLTTESQYIEYCLNELSALLQNFKDNNAKEVLHMIWSKHAVMVSLSFTAKGKLRVLPPEHKDRVRLSDEEDNFDFTMQVLKNLLDEIHLG